MAESLDVERPVAAVPDGPVEGEQVRARMPLAAGQVLNIDAPCGQRDQVRQHVARRVLPQRSLGQSRGPQRARRGPAVGRATARSVHHLDGDPTDRLPRRDVEHPCVARGDPDGRVIGPELQVSKGIGIGIERVRRPAALDSPDFAARERIVRSAAILGEERVLRTAQAGLLRAAVGRAERRVLRKHDLALRGPQRQVQEPREPVPLVVHPGRQVPEPYPAAAEMDDLRYRHRAGVTAAGDVDLQRRARRRHTRLGRSTRTRRVSAQ